MTKLRRAPEKKKEEFKLGYRASPTCSKFHKSTAFVRGIRGPIGSGKSVAMCVEMFIRARQQKPGHDGIRRTRWAAVRNTQPQLETTTIKTWLDWFPEEIFGKMSRKPPFTHTVKVADIEMEVVFLALDKPEDVKKLLSFEATGIWLNEAREIPYEVLSAATGRVGRFPSSKSGAGCTWSGVIMDTNPPTDDHWWYAMAEEDAWAVNEKGEKLPLSKVKEESRWEFFAQPSGLDEFAENLENLNQPDNFAELTIQQRRDIGRIYYERQLSGKNQEWINVYVHGEYGFIKSGQPVYKGSWNPDIHVAKEKIPLAHSGIIYVGIDASGRHPAAVFAQKTTNGRIQIVHEVCVTDDQGMGAVTFAKMLKREMMNLFPRHDFDIWGDPAGDWGQNSDERTYFDILRAESIHCKSSPGLRIPTRIESVINALERMVQGLPAIEVSPTCKVLLGGFNGGYRYKRLNVSGESKYDDKPEKNRYADVQDALQYMLCGMGETKRMLGRNKSPRQTVIARTNFKL